MGSHRLPEPVRHFNIRIPHELAEQMKRYPDINFSAAARWGIREAVRRANQRRRVRRA